MLEGTYSCVFCKTIVSPISRSIHDYGTLCPESLRNKMRLIPDPTDATGSSFISYYEDTDGVREIRGRR